LRLRQEPGHNGNRYCNHLTFSADHLQLGMLGVLHHARNAVAGLLPLRLMTSCAIMVGLVSFGLRQNRLTNQENEPCQAHPEPFHAASLVQKMVRERVAAQTDSEPIHAATVQMQLPATSVGEAYNAASSFSAPAEAEISQQPNAGFLDPATQQYLSQLGAATSATQQQGRLLDQAHAYLGQLNAAAAAQQQVSSAQPPTVWVSPRSSSIPLASAHSLFDVNLPKQRLDQALTASAQIMMQGKLDREAEATRNAEQRSEAILKRLHESEGVADSMHKRIRELEAEVDRQRLEEATESQFRNNLQLKLSQADVRLKEAQNRVVAAQAKQMLLQQAAQDSEARRIEAQAHLAAKTREEMEHMKLEKASEERIAQYFQESSQAVHASREMVQQSAASLSNEVAQLQEAASAQLLKLRQELNGQKETAQEASRTAQEASRAVQEQERLRIDAERRLADTLAALQDLEHAAIQSSHSDSPQLRQVNAVHSQATSWPVPEPALSLQPVATAPETLASRSSPELTLPLMEPVAPLAPLPAPPLVNAQAVQQESTKQGGTLQGLLNQLYVLLAEHH